MESSQAGKGDGLACCKDKLEGFKALIGRTTHSRLGVK